MNDSSKSHHPDHDAVRRHPRHAPRVFLYLKIVAVLLTVGAIGGATWWIAQRRDAAQDASSPPDDALVYSDYAGAESCRACHATEFTAWSKSHHGLAERNVSAELDRVAFEPARQIKHGTQTSSARIDQGKMQVMTTGTSGQQESFEPKRVIGVDPLRQFLVEAPGGRMQTLELTYDPMRKDWFDVFGAEDRQPGEYGHWTGRGMNWNAMCASCHNTRVLKKYDAQTDTYHTTMAEMSVSCEACHGPMKPHVQWQTQYRGSGQKEPHARILTPEQSFETCGTCHSRRGELVGDFIPGDSFFEHFLLESVDETEVFYPDGQVHDEDYELSAFFGSKMHAAGVRCADCHDSHSGKTKLPGNALCMRCHVGAFPKAPIIVPAQHTFHKDDSLGSQCISCHMPTTTYMQRHVRHDHGFTVPDPQLTRELGIPNACNRCHVDKDPVWAQTAVDKWYGSKMERPTRARTRVIAAARKREESARTSLTKLLADDTQAPYWKAAYVRLLGRWVGDPETAALLQRQLQAAHPMVRERAAASLAPLCERVPAVAGALNAALADPNLSVRISAANALGKLLDPESPAARELKHYFDRNADTPQGQFHLAGWMVAQGKSSEAIEHLELALKWDPRNAMMHSGAATIYGEVGRPKSAMAELLEAGRLDKTNADYPYLYALAANEAGEPDEAERGFSQSVQRNPNNGRVWYNFALFLTRRQNIERAAQAYARGEAADPHDPDIPFGYAILLAQQGRVDEARAAAERALKINPSYAPAIDLLNKLKTP